MARRYWHLRCVQNNSRFLAGRDGLQCQVFDWQRFSSRGSNLWLEFVSGMIGLLSYIVCCSHDYDERAPGYLATERTCAHIEEQNNEIAES